MQAPLVVAYQQRVAEKIMSAYHVPYERDESGWWVASVREVRGCHTQGRTVDEARRRERLGAQSRQGFAHATWAMGR